MRTLAFTHFKFHAGYFQLSTTSSALFAACLVVVSLCGCSIFSLGESSEISRIALLAPFEGRYREVGYDAYYAVRLALSDAKNANIELLAVDDGGTATSAAERAKALAKDPLIQGVITLGYAATDSSTQAAFGQVPVLIVGEWGAKPVSENIFVLASDQLSENITAPDTISITEATTIDAPVVGTDLFALKQFIQLRPNTEGIRIASSGSLPDEAFRERYLQSTAFVPEPGLLATLTYDAANLLLQAIDKGNTLTTIENMHYEGINGIIQFKKGYWADAPINYFCYQQSTDTKATTRGIADMLYPC